MDNFIELRSNLCFKYFEEISKIPRGTGNEKAISDYFVSFAMERNLEVIQDEALNVIIKKPGTDGYEKIPTVIIQGHMDMVCEKNSDSIHDFKNDPLTLRVEGEMIYAAGTTLGGDDGVALAYCLALLDSNDIVHPNLEILLTTEEEISMKGAFNIDPCYLRGRTLINLDSDADDKIIVGSAGGVNGKHILPINWNVVEGDYLPFQLSVRGLNGGHSGIDINLGRGNSIKIIGRILYDLSLDNKICMGELNCGMNSNAIPREAEALILVRTKDIDNVMLRICDWNKKVKNELKSTDSGVNIEIVRINKKIDKVFSEETMEKAIYALAIIPSGVVTGSTVAEGLVESSTNLGVVKTYDKEIVFKSDIRSSIKSMEEYIIYQMKVIGKLLDCKFIDYFHYPAWPYNSNSNILELFKKVYRGKYRKELGVIALHAGLECGILIEKMPYLDAVSYGPNVYDIHTPDEHICINSFIQTWELLIEVLREMKN